MNKQLSKEQIIQIAIQAAKAGGAYLAEQKYKTKKVNCQDARDVKLQADIDTETIIRKILGESTDFPIVGEEMGGNTDLMQQDVYYWIIDPLDGTYNYLRGTPMCCVSLGLFSGTTPIMGVIYDFNTDQLYVGDVESKSFTINGEVVKPVWAESTKQACLSVGFPASLEVTQNKLNDVCKYILEFKKIRMIGSCAISMAYVASGVMDVYHEEGVHLWDFAAGAALILAAGGYVKMEPMNHKPFAYKIWGAGKPEWLNL
jgi:myo-inositol-1(or 4)-monophosphatase